MALRAQQFARTVALFGCYEYDVATVSRALQLSTLVLRSSLRNTRYTADNGEWKRAFSVKEGSAATAGHSDVPRKPQTNDKPHYLGSAVEQKTASLLVAAANLNSCASVDARPSLLPPHQPLWDERSTSAPMTIAVAMSGGVDSSVAAKRLVDAGHQVFGVFMRSWDETEELANSNCSIERDFQDARRVCRQLDIPLLEADFTAQYWQHVFQPFLDKYAMGLTPNPDLACNRAIKFGPMLKHAELHGADHMATGHYARLLPQTDLDPLLLKGVDTLKDQSYFLASVPAAALKRCMFPLGSNTKHQTRQEATEARLPISTKRGSAGICFVGRRKFSDFVDQYVEPVAGQYIDIDAPSVGIPCENVLSQTIGQRATIGGRPQRSYIIGKDVSNCVVYVAQGSLHPALFCRDALLLAPSWVGENCPTGITHGRPIGLSFKARYGQPAYECTVQTAAAAAAKGAPFRGSRFSCCRAVAAAQTFDNGQLIVRFQDPMRAITPGQELVLYDGDVCLGSAMIIQPGQSLAELGLQMPPEWRPCSDSVHMDILHGR